MKLRSLIPVFGPVIAVVGVIGTWYGIFHQPDQHLQAVQATSFGQQGGVTAGTINIVPIQPPPDVENARRRDLLAKLRNEYILSHDNLSPALLAGIDQPPIEWVNQRLHELGEGWRVGGKP